MLNEIKAVHVGLGPMGLRVVQHILGERRGIRYVGAVDLAPELKGKDLGELAGLPACGVKISNDAGKVFSDTGPDIAIYTTVSPLESFLPQTEIAIEHGIDVISTCEELAFPRFIDPDMAVKYNELCQRRDVTMLGTGINPGFLMDMRAAVLSAACTDVQRVVITRRMDATPRRQPFQKKVGAGMDARSYKRATATGEITGHVGLDVSICLLADALGWELSEVKVTPPEAVIAEKAVSSEYFKVALGQVKGSEQSAIGVVDGEEKIRLNFSAFLGATPSYDEVEIYGTPEIKARITPCWHGDFGTVGMVANLIPAVLNAPSGLLTINDIVPISFKSGDMSRFVSPKK